MTFDFIVMLLIVKIFYIFYQPIVMIFPQFVIYVLIYDYLKFRKDPSITSQEIANNISVALAVALSVYRFNTASYKPRHEKICLRDERPGRRHKMVCMSSEAS